MSSTMSSSETSKANSLLRVIDAFRVIDAEMSAQTMYTILLLHQRPNITVQEVADQLGMTQPTASRIIYRLSKIVRAGQAGHDLVEAEENPENRREKLCRLSSKGERFVRGLLAHL